MNTFITGGHGLVGKEITFGLKPSKNELNLLDLENVKKYIQINNISNIAHIAALVGGVKSNTDWVYDYFSYNMRMNLNILECCKEFNIKQSIFVISTCAFPKEAPLPLHEESLHDGEPHYTNYGYAYSKRMLEVGSRSLKQQYNLNSLCIIPCNLYGKNDNYNLNSGHVIPSLIHKCYLAKQNNTTFEIWGSGKAEREFIYAKDIADIIKKLFDLNTELNGTMIISPDNIYTIEEIVEKIVKKMKFNGKVYFDKSKPEGILKKNSNNSRFRNYFSNYKFTDLDTGLDLTIDYFLNNYEHLRK